MKVYLDDIRPTPDGWHRTYNVQETINILEKYQVVELSLDYDLGEDLETMEQLAKGKEVLVYILDRLKKTHDVNFVPSLIHLHTGNIIGKREMEFLLADIIKIMMEIGYEHT